MSRAMNIALCRDRKVEFSPEGTFSRVTKISNWSDKFVARYPVAKILQFEQFQLQALNAQTLLIADIDRGPIYVDNAYEYRLFLFNI